jgi:hypothetical protein
MAFLTEAANRGSIATGYDIDNSLKLEADNTEFMDRTISITGNRKTWTYSGWVKRTEISFAGDGFGHTFFFGGAYGSEACLLRFNTGTTAATLDTLQIDIGFGGTLSRSHTSQRFRDISAWYHIVLAVDTTQSTATDRFKLYVNGELVTSYYSRNNPAQNFDTGNNYQSSGYVNNVGAYKSGGTTYGKFCGYIAEVNHVDGAALAPTAFGEFDEDSGIWKPKAYTGSYGNNGFYLDFESSGSLGADSSGNGNNFTLNNITSADQATDTPTNNFAIPNVIGTTRTNKFTYTEGGTKVVSAGSADWDSWANTIAVGNGKWYAEFKIINTGSYFVGVGSEEYYFIGAGNGAGFPEIYYGYTGTNSVGYHGNNGDIYNNGTQVVIGTTYTANDIISVALDMDNGKVYFAKNGTYINSQNPVTGTNAQNLPDTEARYFIGTSQFQASLGVECNYGGYTTFSISSAASDANGYGTFEYAPPSRLLCLMH